MIRIESTNLIVPKYVWKVEYPSNYCHTRLNLMKNRILKEMMDVLFISSGLHKTFVEQLPYYFKREQQKVFISEWKRFGLIRIKSFRYEKWKGRKSNLKYFNVWVWLSKVQVPIPKMIKIWTKNMDSKLRLK